MKEEKTPMARRITHTANSLPTPPHPGSICTPQHVPKKWDVEEKHHLHWTEMVLKWKTASKILPVLLVLLADGYCESPPHTPVDGISRDRKMFNVCFHVCWFGSLRYLPAIATYFEINFHLPAITWRLTGQSWATRNYLCSAMIQRYLKSWSRFTGIQVALAIKWPGYPQITMGRPRDFQKASD